MNEKEGEFHQSITLVVIEYCLTNALDNLHRFVDTVSSLLDDLRVFAKELYGSVGANGDYSLINTMVCGLLIFTMFYVISKKRGFPDEISSAFRIIFIQMSASALLLFTVRGSVEVSWINVTYLILLVLLSIGYLMCKISPPMEFKILDPAGPLNKDELDFILEIPSFTSEARKASTTDSSSMRTCLSSSRSSLSFSTAKSQPILNSLNQELNSSLERSSLSLRTMESQQTLDLLQQMIDSLQSMTYLTRQIAGSKPVIKWKQVTEPQQGIGSKPVIKWKRVTELQPAADSQPVAGSQGGPQSAVTDSQSVTSSQATTEPVADSHQITEPQPVADSQLVADSKSVAEPAADSQSAAEPQPVEDSKLTSEQQQITEPVTDLQPVAEPETSPQLATEPETSPQQIAEPQQITGLQPVTEPKPVRDSKQITEPVSRQPKGLQRKRRSMTILQPETNSLFTKEQSEIEKLKEMLLILMKDAYEKMESNKRTVALIFRMIGTCITSGMLSFNLFCSASLFTNICCLVVIFTLFSGISLKITGDSVLLSKYLDKLDYEKNPGSLTGILKNAAISRHRMNNTISF